MPSLNDNPLLPMMSLPQIYQRLDAEGQGSLAHVLQEALQAEIDAAQERANDAIENVTLSDLLTELDTAVLLTALRLLQQANDSGELPHDEDGMLMGILTDGGHVKFGTKHLSDTCDRLCTQING